MRAAILIALCALAVVNDAYALGFLALGGSSFSTVSPVGNWINVTPAGVDLNDNLDCGNFGTQSVGVDTQNPGTMYAEFNCQGIWKSTDYGQTWAGPVNTGTNGAPAGDCAGGISVNPGATLGSAATIYESCIRGAYTGFMMSTDGGVNWSIVNLTPLAPDRQDVYAPVVDPYNRNILLMAGHEQDALIESTDAGATWINIPINAGMNEGGGTAAEFFIDTGSSTTTAQTWLWMAQQSGGIFGTWRTTNGGASATWTQVDTNEHPHGSSQVYQPGPGGVLYMAGAYSSLGWGVLRSTDLGVTWTHVGGTGNQGIAFGTPKNVSSMISNPAQGNAMFDPGWETTPQPGTGAWTTPGTPAGMTNGAAIMAVTNDGTHNILVGANWGAGLWRYVEP